MKRLSFFLFIILTNPVIHEVQSLNFNVQDERKIALVIGNSSYQQGYLKNPVNDARSITRVLRAKGFDVILRENVANKDDMKRAVREFGNKIQNGGVGLFYYAGHGVQVKGINYLIPVRAQINIEEEIEYESLDVGFVLAQMEAARNRMNIVILDACRNNPFARSFRSADRGLATINAPTGTLIAYATAPGSVASDGSGENGLYTEMLLKHIDKPGLKIEEVFKNVRAEVLDKSNGIQIPWESSSLVGDFYFTPSDEMQILANQTITYISPPKSSETEDFFINTSSLPEPSAGIATWKASNDYFWLKIDGRFEEKNTTFEWQGKNLVVTHTPSGKKYLLENFQINSDNEWREALTLQSMKDEVNKPDTKRYIATWKASDAGYWLMLNGEDISKQTTNEWSGQNLLVHFPERNLKFTLFNYASNMDNSWRPARVMVPGKKEDEFINVQWMANNQGYWLTINGSDVSKQTSSTWEGDDLVVYHNTSGHSWILRDYKKRTDSQWRAAEKVE